MSLDQFPRWTRLYRGKSRTLGARFAVAIVFAPGLLRMNERGRLFMSTDGGAIFQEMYLSSTHLTLAVPQEGETLEISFLVPRLASGEVSYATLLVEQDRAILPFVLSNGIDLVSLPHDYVENLPQNYVVNMMGGRRLELCQAYKMSGKRRPLC